MPTPIPATAAQMPIAFGRSSAGKTFVRIDSVVGMISAPPIPIRALVAISMFADSANAEASEAPPKITRPGDECTAAAEAVAEGAHGEEQSGEDERVRVDDPLELAAARVELALDGR